MAYQLRLDRVVGNVLVEGVAGIEMQEGNDVTADANEWSFDAVDAVDAVAADKDEDNACRWFQTRGSSRCHSMSCGRSSGSSDGMGFEDPDDDAVDASDVLDIFLDDKRWILDFLASAKRHQGPTDRAPIMDGCGLVGAAAHPKSRR